MSMCGVMVVFVCGINSGAVVVLAGVILYGVGPKLFPERERTMREGLIQS